MRHERSSIVRGYKVMTWKSLDSVSPYAGAVVGANDSFNVIALTTHDSWEEAQDWHDHQIGELLKRPAPGEDS